MSKFILVFFLAISFLQIGISQEIEVYQKYDDLKTAVLDVEDEKVYIVNFWATWCGPCVKELPYFEAVKSEYDGKKVEVILVSIDWLTNLDEKVKPFVAKKGLKKKVILFDDPKTNNWIDKIDPSWSGAIPITLFISKGKKQFYEKDYHSVEELEADLQTFINQ